MRPTRRRGPIVSCLHRGRSAEGSRQGLSKRDTNFDTRIFKRSASARHSVRAVCCIATERACRGLPALPQPVMARCPVQTALKIAILSGNKVGYGIFSTDHGYHRHQRRRRRCIYRCRWRALCHGASCASSRAWRRQLLCMVPPGCRTRDLARLGISYRR